MTLVRELPITLSELRVQTSPPEYDIEAHESAAIVHFRGALSLPAVHSAITSTENLPGQVRHLFVDLRGVHDFDPLALDAIASLLSRWRTAREGGTRVELPRPPVLGRAD